MVTITSLAEAEKLLAKYIPLAKSITGKNITLDRMKLLMTAIGSPHENLNIIHIAGTSGKTSTAYYISKLLSAAGNKTGLTVSPHVDSVIERLQINNQPLSEEEFVNALSEFVPSITFSNLEPTYFELLVAFAYWYFAKTGVDYAVVETGMGGLQDGTNIAQNPNKVCVITDIGLDHMHILGSTIQEIARQKAGIIHWKNSVIMYDQSDDVMNEFKIHCNKLNAKLDILNEQSLLADKELPSYIRKLPDFQKRNWLLAYETYKFIAARDNLPKLTIEQLTNIMQIKVPGRMDLRLIKGKTIIMDGAHNEQKMQAFVTSLTHLYPNKQFPVLLSLKEGKEFSAVLPLLKPITSRLIITSFDTNQDLPAKSIDPKELGKAAEKFGFKNIDIETDQSKALQLLISDTASIAVITGSFYLLGQLRNKHRELINA